MRQIGHGEFVAAIGKQRNLPTMYDCAALCRQRGPV
jgi:hypothetical protein